MRRRVAFAAVVLLGLAGASVWWWRRSVSPGPPAPAPAPVQAAALPTDSPEIVVACDPIPEAPPLPETLTPTAMTVDAIVRAIDESLSPAHKEFLRCFPDENTLVGRVHFGMGRWLRNALRLRQQAGAIPELSALGVKEPDEVSAVLVRAYARFLRQAPIDLPDAVARTRKLGEVPTVTP
jgi:hypothetical protein